MTAYDKDILTIISAAGDSKAKAFEALKEVKNRDYNKARKLLQEARESDINAHKVQAKLIQEEICGDNQKMMTLLMAHAQDHYMTSQLARDLIEALIEIFESKESEVK